MVKGKVQAGVSGANDLRNCRERKQKIFRSRRDRLRYEMGNSERSWCRHGASWETLSSCLRNGRQCQLMRNEVGLQSQVCVQGRCDKLPSFFQLSCLTKGSTVIFSCCYLCISHWSVSEEVSNYGFSKLHKQPTHQT